MNPRDREIAMEFSRSLAERGVPAFDVVVFGSRARGDATPESDLDLLVVAEMPTKEMRDLVGECAYQVGLESDLFVQAIIKRRSDIEEGVERVSAFIRNVRREGIALEPGRGISVPTDRVQGTDDAALKDLVRRGMEIAEQILLDADVLNLTSGCAGSVAHIAHSAAHHAARALLETKGLSPKGDRGTLAAFDAEFVKSGVLDKSANARLQWLLETKIKYEYLDDDTIEKTGPSQAVEKAREFLTQVRDCLIQQGFISEPNEENGENGQ